MPNTDTPANSGGAQRPQAPDLCAAWAAFDAGNLSHARRLCAQVDASSLNEADRDHHQILVRGLRFDGVLLGVPAVMAAVWVYLAVTVFGHGG